MRKYNRAEPSFASTLLMPDVADVTMRLMSPRERAALHRRVKLPALSELVDLLGSTDLESPEIAAKELLAAMQDYQDNIIGRFASYPDDFNYLANAIGKSESRYNPWFIDMNGLHITPGVTTIFADTGAGKSTMADLVVFNLLEHYYEPEQVMRVKFGESGSDLETFLRFSELAEALPSQLPPVIVIDSVRLQTFDMGGASRSLSISNRLFRWLTEVDVFAVGAGVAVILVMNPLTGEEDKIAQFRSDVESSVMSVVNLKDWRSGTFKHRGPQNGRKEEHFTLDGEIEREGEGTNIRESGDVVLTSATTSSELNPSTSATSQMRTSFGRVRTTKA